MFVSDAVMQLIEQFRLLICYGIDHALFPGYLMLNICTVSCQSRARLGLRRNKGICITAVTVHNGRQLS